MLPQGRSEPLQWRMGSGRDGEDACARICMFCASEVYSFKEGLICSGCGRTPAETGRGPSDG